MGQRCCVAERISADEAQDVHKLRLAETVEGLTQSTPKEFWIAIDKDAGAPLGLAVDFEDPGLPRVVAVHPGTTVEEYNKRAKADEHVQVGDFMIEVNGVSGSTPQMLRRVSEDSHLRCLFRRPLMFQVTITRIDDSFGLDITYHHSGTSLIIQKVEGGSLAVWNIKNPDTEVMAGDYIVKINGTEGKADDLLRTLQESKCVDLLILRPEV